MTTARDIMTPDVTCVSETEDMVSAARKMADLDVGAIPVCDSEGRLCGVVTDRDLAVKIVAAGQDPETVRLSDLVDNTGVVTIGADDSVEDAIRTMKDHAVRRLPVMDGNALVGMVSQADIARAMPDTTIGDLVDAISSAPPN